MLWIVAQAKLGDWVFDYPIWFITDILNAGAEENRRTSGGKPAKRSVTLSEVKAATKRLNNG